MKRYFVNPELRGSSIILLALMALFLISVSFILKFHHKQLKDDYIESLGAVAMRTIEVEPALEKKIISLITREVSEEEAAKGKAFLKEYGLSDKLEDELFPYINRAVPNNTYAIILIFILMTSLLFILNYLQYGFFYERIRKVAMAANKVVEGEYDISISENMEGDFSKLAFSFNSMRNIIRNNISELKREKQFLADLLSDISHQLKTPLSSMIVYNDIMLNKELSREQRQTFLKNTQNQLYRMEWLIKSVLKLARLDANAIDLEMEQQSLNETIQESIDALESKAVEGKIGIVFNENREVIFEHDRLWLEEALINIIKNCIEHTHEGGMISITLNENPVYRRIVIEDTGEGIGQEELPNIFKRFYKGKTSKNNDSVGIGLALARSVVELHNGMIEVHSGIGVGTRFVITFLKLK